MPSVAARILKKLKGRLDAIDGSGDFENDLQGRIFLSRPAYDADAEKKPAVFLARRIGGGTTREQAPGKSELSTTTVVFDAIGVIALGNECAVTAEDLLADLHRALEIPDDLYMRDEQLGKNLLSQELQITDVEFNIPEAEIPVVLVSVSISCTYPHKYGDPDYVQ